MANEKLLEIKNLTVHYQSYDATVHAVENLNLSLGNGETLGLVGETCAGKTTTVKSIMRILPTPPARVVSGEIFFDGQDLLKVSEKEMRKIRGKEIAMIFQDPIESLNPKMTIEEIVGEGLKVRGQKDRDEIHRQVVEMLEKVGLVEEHATRYPHEFSGGQRQRIGIARAIITKPKLVIADEPVSALDVSVQAQVINLLNDLKDEMGLSILFIAHNLSVVKYFSDRIGVMYYGHLVEVANGDDLYKNPLHPYTKALLSAIPEPNPITERTRKRVDYDPERDHDYSVEKPSMVEVEPEHFVYCSPSELEAYRKQLKD